MAYITVAVEWCLKLSPEIHTVDSKAGFEISTIQFTLQFTDACLLQTLPFMWGVRAFPKKAFFKNVLYNLITQWYNKNFLNHFHGSTLESKNLLHCAASLLI